MAKQLPVALMFLLGLALLCGWCYSMFRPAFEFGGGSGGAGAVSSGWGGQALLLLLTILGLALVGLWTLARAIYRRIQIVFRDRGGRSG